MVKNVAQNPKIVFYSNTIGASEGVFPCTSTLLYYDKIDLANT